MNKVEKLDIALSIKEKEESPDFTSGAGKEKNLPTLCRGLVKRRIPRFYIEG